MKKIYFPLLMILGSLAAPVGATSDGTPGYAPHSHALCTQLELSDPACHRQIVEAGGTPRAVSDATRDFTPRDFEGQTVKQRWYSEYRERARQAQATPKPYHRAIAEDYPRFPVFIPDYIGR